MSTGSRGYEVLQRYSREALLVDRAIILPDINPHAGIGIPTLALKDLCEGCACSGLIPVTSWLRKDCLARSSPPSFTGNHRQPDIASRRSQRFNFHACELHNLFSSCILAPQSPFGGGDISFMSRPNASDLHKLVPNPNSPELRST